jgi:hypothetical protein
MTANQGDGMKEREQKSRKRREESERVFLAGEILTMSKGRRHDRDGCDGEGRQGEAEAQDRPCTSVPDLGM